MCGSFEKDDHRSRKPVSNEARHLLGLAASRCPRLLEVARGFCTFAIGAWLPKDLCAPIASADRCE
jgi:hypothetical protein